MTFWDEIYEVCKKYNLVIHSCDGCWDIGARGITNAQLEVWKKQVCGEKKRLKNMEDLLSKF